MKQYFQLLKAFLALESSSGLALFLAAFFAIFLANSPLADAYNTFWHTPWFSWHPPLFWINEGLMTLFFFLVGLELKREFISGELQDFSQAALPLIAALGGMLLPGLIYSLLNYQHPEAYRGWAIPVATDIAFALGALALLGKRIPLSLKLFLMALAIFDDIGAIMIISFFYAQHFAWLPLIGASLALLLGVILNRLQVSLLWPYIIVGLFLWMFIFESGIHPTITGVLLAFLLPYKPGKPNLLDRLEAALHPWVAYGIMPLFALANAGFSFSKVPGLFDGPDKIALGTLLGLLLGKPLGVFGFAFATIKSGWGKLPQGSSWSMLGGVSILCGIGFTMSLFLGTLAFSYSELYMSEVRLGVFLGSIFSGIMGGLLLWLATRLKGK